MHGDDAQGIMDELTAQQPYIWPLGSRTTDARGFVVLEGATLQPRIFLWTFAACASFASRLTQKVRMD